MHTFSARQVSATAFEKPLTTGGACYATIGPLSTVDVVDVGGQRLHVGGLVAVKDGMELRPRRRVKNFIPTLQLQLWMPGEHPLPQPRAPWLARATWEYAAAVDATWTQRLVVPFAGRRACRLSFYMDEASGVASYDYAIEAWMFGDPEHAAAGANVSVLDGSAQLVPNTKLTSGGTGAGAHTITIGGWDSEEAAGELVVWTRKPLAGTVPAATLEVEAWGELGRGW